MNSSQWYERAMKVIPGGVNSPVRAAKHVGAEPVYFRRGEGANLYDVDGKAYTDFCLSFGPHILGHSHPAVVKAIQEQAARATSFGACHEHEVLLAEKLLAAYPFLQRARLVNSGTEAVMTAVRVARGFTGRSKIVVFDGCYHGHSDGLLAKAGSGVAELSEATSKGIPASVVEDTLVARLDDLEGLKTIFAQYANQIAAVLIEPIPANYGLYVPSRADLQTIVELARTSGALVIFDEVIMGFRAGASGAAGYYDLKPDLVTLGKIIGGGLPLAALLGREHIMDRLAPLGDVYQAGTLSGNPLAVAAGLAVLEQLEAEPPYLALERHTQEFGLKLEALLNRWKPSRVRTFQSIFWIEFGDESGAFPPQVTPEAKATYAEFYRQALARGIFFAPSPYEVGFLSTAHTETILNEVIEKLGTWLNKL